MNFEYSFLVTAHLTYTLFKISAAFTRVSSVFAKQKRNIFSSKLLTLKTENGMDAIFFYFSQLFR